MNTNLNLRNKILRPGKSTSFPGIFFLGCNFDLDVELFRYFVLLDIHVSIWDRILEVICEAHTNLLWLVPSILFANDLVGDMFDHAYFTLASLDNVKTLWNSTSSQNLLTELELLLLQFACNWKHRE